MKKVIYIKKLIIFIFFLCLKNKLVAIEKINNISFIIGNEIILDSEIPKHLNNNNCKIIKQLFINKIILNESKKNKEIKKIINKKEIEKEIKNKIKKIINEIGSEKELLDQNDFKNIEDIYYNIMNIIENKEYIKIYKQKILNGINPSPKEVKLFFQKKKINKKPKKIELKIISISPILDKKKIKIKINQLKKIKKDIEKKNINFAIKAIMYSDDIKTSNKGGEVKNFISLNKIFDNIVISLKEGQISEPFESENGFHIVKIEKKNNNVINIKHILFKKKYTKEEINKTIKIIFLIKNMIKNEKISIKNAFNKYSNKKFEINNKIKFNSIPEKVLKNLKLKKLLIINEKNKRKYFFLIKKHNIIKSRKISIEKDYEKIKNIVKIKQYYKKIKNIINNKIKYYNLKIDDKYKKCLLKYK